ncbi:hypothetical protein ADJ79_00550 [Ottowia sp. oral taxon 894]|nr:hypothetical protein ADJ79_00550 [Ottowia sp. oral taxon 894]
MIYKEKTVNASVSTASSRSPPGPNPREAASARPEPGRPWRAWRSMRGTRPIRRPTCCAETFAREANFPGRLTP